MPFPQANNVPDVPKGKSVELIAHVRLNATTTTTRAMHYANALETKVPGGVEVFTGWCKFLADGTRVGGINGYESVFAWEFPKHNGLVDWVKSPIQPIVAKGGVRQFLVSFQRFGEKKPLTITAWYANEFQDFRGPTNRGVPTYNGWLIGHPSFNLGTFITIGDIIIAWAELPECKVEE